MKAWCWVMISGLIAAPLLAQVDGPVRQPPQRPPSGGGGGGVGIGVGISLGKKKKKVPEAPSLPPLEMRDQGIPDYVANQALFFVKADAGSVARIARAARVTVIETSELSEIGVIMVTTSLTPPDTVEAATARLSRQKGVEWAQPNHLFQALGETSRDKGMKLHGLKIGSKENVTGTIVMIDSTVDIANPALKGAGATQSLFGVSAAPGPHGTAIAELLVGTGDYSGVARGASLVSLAAFEPASEKSWLSQTRYLAKAMNEGSRLRPQLVNLSFGANRDDEALIRLLAAMERNGMCVVAAAGNGSGKPVLFPARQPSVIAVTAVDGQKRAYAYASRGPEVDIAAWGVGLSAAVPGGRRAVSGTSFATAIVSGALLRLKGCNGGHNPAGVRSGLVGLAEDLGDKGADPVFGAGLMQLGLGKKK